ncbi:MAG: hypothetical protein ACE1ZV_07345, partial [Alphaproteobacteria bacterium]
QRDAGPSGQPRNAAGVPPPHRRPPSFVRQCRCGLLAVPAPRRNPRLSGGKIICGEMSPY